MLKTKKLGAKKLVAAASSLALLGGLAVTSPVAAADKSLTGASFAWKISPCAFDVVNASACASIQQNQSVSGNVTKGADGWTFTNGTGTTDDASGNTSIAFAGTISLGNNNRGAYKINISNPTLETAGSTGTLTADVQYQLPKLNNNPAEGYVSSPVTNMKVLDLQNVQNQNGVITADSEASDPSGNYADASGANPDGQGAHSAGFATEFTDFLVTAKDLKDENDVPVPGAASLAAWFQMTANGTSSDAANVRKKAEPISASFFSPKIELVGATGIPVNKSKTITIKGTGFDPAFRTQGLYAVFGPEAAQVKPPYPAGSQAEADNFYSAVPLFNGGSETFPNADGEFQTTIKVAGLYKNSKGQTLDARKTALGVSVWAAHSNAVPSYRLFSKVNFVQGAVSYSKPGKVKSAKRGKTTKSTAKVTWKAPTATKVEFRNNAATYYQVRATNKKGKKYGKWVKVSSRSYTFKKLSKKGSWKFQIRAVGKAGAGSVVTLKLNRR